MASGYIGKISAVVTANTSLLSRELLKSAQDANKFANSLKNSIDRGADAASASIEKIFTPLQMLERKLKQAESRGLKLNMPSEQIRAFVSASEQINRPLEQASKQFSKLGLDVQGAFLPALNAAQDAAIRVNREIQQTGSASEGAFTRAQAAVEATTLSLSRLAQAEALVGKGMAGNELQFTNPALFQALQSAAKATQAAAGLSPQQLADGVITKRVRELQAYQQEALKAEAVLESLELQPNIDPSVIEAQRKKVQELSETTRRASEFVLTGLSSSTTPGGEALADNLKEQNRLRQEAIEKGNELLNVFSREEAAQIRLSEQVRKANVNSRISRQEKSERIRADVLSDEKFALDLDNREIDAYLQKIGVLKTVISGLGSGDTKDAESAIRRLGETAAIAFDDKNIRTGGVKRELDQIEREAVEAAAAVSGIPVEELGRRLNTAGDVGRRGVDKFSLAVNQAAFAIDDFFSATGGLEFKIRAVQNNLTQLGFILDGTRGLFLALGAAIAGQLVIALLKANGLLEEQKDILDALSSAFDEQKRRVDELASAYNKLGQSIENAGLSDRQRTEAERRRELDDIRRQQEELRIARAAAVDPRVNELRVEASRLTRLASESTSPGFRAAVEAQLESIFAEIEQASRDAATRVSTKESVRAVIETQGLAAIGTEFGIADRGIDLSPVRLSPSGTVSARARLARERARREQEFRDSVAGLDLSDLESQRRELLALQATIREGREGLSFFNDIFGIAADEYDAQLSELAAELAALETQINEAGVGEALIAVFEEAVGLARALDSARASLEGSGVEEGVISEQLNQINQLQNQLISQARTARESGDQAALAAIEESIRGLDEWAGTLSSAANATRILAETLSRVSTDLASTVASEVRSAADKERRKSNAAEEDPLATGAQRRVAETRRFEAELFEKIFSQAVAELEESRLSVIQQFERDAAAGFLGVVIQDLIDERSRLEEELNAEGTPLERRQQIQARKRIIDAELSKEFEDSLEGRLLKTRADALDMRAAKERQRLESAARGEDLIASNAEKVGEQLARNLLDIREAFNLRWSAGLEDQDNLQADAEARLIAETRRQIAPAVFALVDESANAVAQGPSRARLSASDITTQAGTDELNRLLRGDDSARDQNLIELRKQTQQLEEANRTLKNLGVAP